VTWLDDLEERLVRAGARGISQQLANQVGRALGRDEGGASHGPDDVWDVATHEDPGSSGEPPECAWCPLCRAIRLSRQSGPGLAGHVSGAADALASAAQDALDVLDDVMSRSAARRDRQPPESPGTAAGSPGTAPGSPGAAGPRGAGESPGAGGSHGTAGAQGEERPERGRPEHPGDGPAGPS